MKQQVISFGGGILIIGAIIFSQTPVAAITVTPPKNTITEVNSATTIKTCEEVVSEQDSVKQSIQEISELFISRSFSENSNLEDLNLIDSNSSRSQEYVNIRHHLINMRREAFSGHITESAIPLVNNYCEQQICFLSAFGIQKNSSRVDPDIVFHNFHEWGDMYR